MGGWREVPDTGRRILFTLGNKFRGTFETYGRDLQGFAGLGRGNPVAGAAMVVFLISFVCILPLGGFVSKFLLFGAAIDSGFT